MHFSRTMPCVFGASLDGFSFPLASSIMEIIGVGATCVALVIALMEFRRARKELRRSYSPVLLVEFGPTSGTGDAVTFSHHVDHPVVQKVSFIVRNDGNGPSLNMMVKVFQGNLNLERSVHPSWTNRGISLQELNRNSLAKGGQMECFFSVRAGFTPPEPNQPLHIVIVGENSYRDRFEFSYEASMDLLSALGEAHRTLMFTGMKEL